TAGLACDRERKRGYGFEPDSAGVEVAHRLPARTGAQQDGEPVVDQPVLVAPGDRLDDYLAAVDFGGFHDLDPAMIGAVGDADFERAEDMAFAVDLEDQPERPEAQQTARPPGEIADPAQPLLEPVRDRGADERREADGGA